jgi:hypothetical protein
MCVSLSLAPATATAAKYAGEFMRLGLGARAWGYGGAGVAMPGDATAVYWNPALLSQLARRDVMLMHSETFGSLLNYNAASFGLPSHRSEKPLGVGFAVYGLSGGGIRRTALADPTQPISPSNQPEVVETVGHGDWALYAGVGRGLSDAWSLGATLKVLYRDLVDVTGIGLGIDAGVLYRPAPIWNFGLSVYDLTTSLLSYSNGTKEYVNPRAALGFAVRPGGDRFRLSLLADGIFEFEGRQEAAQFHVGEVSCDLRWGAELLYRGAVALRGGMNAKDPTLGVGVVFGRFSVDGAWNGAETLDDSYRVSLSHSW